MGAATSVHRHQHDESAGALPLAEHLHPLHSLNLAITEHHHRESIGDMSLDNLSDVEIQSLIKAYTAHHTALDNEQGLTIGDSKDELARKSMELSRYLNRLAQALVASQQNH